MSFTDPCELYELCAMIKCIIMGFGDLYMVPYIPGILEELLVHGTKTI